MKNVSRVGYWIRDLFRDLKWKPSTDLLFRTKDSLFYPVTLPASIWSNDFFPSKNTLELDITSKVHWIIGKKIINVLVGNRYTIVLLNICIVDWLQCGSVQLGYRDVLNLSEFKISKISYTLYKQLKWHDFSCGKSQILVLAWYKVTTTRLQIKPLIKSLFQFPNP